VVTPPDRFLESTMSRFQDAAPRILRFDRYTVALQRRELLEDGVPVDLGGRAYDLLLALIDGDGKVISNEDLMNRVWPGRIVEDNSLHAHVSALRKAFGDNRSLIRTVSGRGYQFTAKVRESDSEFSTSAAHARRPSNLPERVTELIGREDAVEDVSTLVIAHRLITLVGTGGIGKTRLGLEVARNLLPRFADGVWLAELGPLTDPDLVPATVAGALGVMPVSGPVSSERIAQALKGRSILLILDNCEHLIDAVARMAEDLLRASAQVSIVATSREPLLTDAEYVYRVPPLEVPEEQLPNADDDSLMTGALRLLIARVRASEPGFIPDRRFASLAASVCRRLDGIPLAIELAAVRCSALGIEELVARLDDRFRLLAGGRRTALPRHQTLLATFDWSFDLLLDAERVVFRRLAVFVGSFNLAAVVAVVAGDAVDSADVPDHIGQLVSKSLVVTEVSRGTVAYRLLETTRAYALQKLIVSGEFEHHAANHAAHYLDVLERGQAEFESRPAAAWQTLSGRDIDNVRAALAWVHSPAGDADTAEALTVAAVPLWMHLSLVNECRVRVQQALSGGRAREGRNTARDMRLFAALGSALVYTSMGPEGGAAWSRALEIAQALRDGDYQLRALWGLWVDRLNNGEFRESLNVAERFFEVAGSAADPNQAWLGHRLIGISLHFLGEQTRAAVHLDSMLSHYIAPPNLSHIIRYQFDPRVTARCFQARIRWLQGFPDEAMRIVVTTIDEARALGHALSLVNSLGQGACLVALLNGELDAAAAYAALLEEHSTRHGIALWQAWSRCFSGALLVRRGDIETGVLLLRGEFTEHPETRLLPRYMVLLGELAAALAARGEFEEALAAISEALGRAERNEERWYLPELIRIKGQIRFLEAGPDAVDVAEAHFLQAIACAQEQQVLSFELRAAVALARLRKASGRAATARAELQAVYRRFTEGFKTADLVEAKALLEQLN
jgi:predicted ATPase/DNA-binding winged helix-turn-helix (wHTH) protein